MTENLKTEKRIVPQQMTAEEINNKTIASLTEYVFRNYELVACIDGAEVETEEADTPIIKQYDFTKLYEYISQTLTANDTQCPSNMCKNCYWSHSDHMHYPLEWNECENCRNTGSRIYPFPSTENGRIDGEPNKKLVPRCSFWQPANTLWLINQGCPMFIIILKRKASSTAPRWTVQSALNDSEVMATKKE